MKNILVTGAAGNVGSALVKKLLENPENFVVAVDNLQTGSLQKIPFKDLSNFSFIKADVNNWQDFSSMFYARNFDFVFHYAATVGVKRTLDHPISVLADVDGIKNVLNLCKNTGVKRVFFSSSSEVYGEPVEFPQNEHTTPLNSRLPYAIVKNIGEAYLKAYQQEYGLNYTIFRFFNTYGPNQSTDFVIAKFLKAALANQDITIYGDGSQTRTFCFVDDNIDTTIKILEHDLAVNEVLNVGDDQEMTIIDLAKTIIRITHSQSKIINLPKLKDGDMTRRQPDNSKMKEILGRPLLGLEAGLQNMIDALAANKTDNLLHAL